MKNKIIFISICLLIFAAVATNFVLAEDDNEREQENSYQPLVQPIVQPLESVTTPEPVSVTPVTSTQTGLVDSDSDGVIDSLDKYPGEDDFAFGVTDINQNGIIDNLEYLQIRGD